MTSRKTTISLLFILFCFTISSMAEDIHEAAKTGDLDHLKKILSENPSLVNSPDKDKMTPLHHAIDAGNLKAASLLISHGADVNAVNFKTETPLHIAAYEGNAGAVRLLLEHNADPTMREMRDRIPLFLACNWGNDLETVRLLIDAGSDVNDKNNRGEIVLVSTLYYGKKEIIDLLIDRGAIIPDDKEILQRVLYVTASTAWKDHSTWPSRKVKNRTWSGGHTFRCMPALEAAQWPSPRPLWIKALISDKKTGTVSNRCTLQPRTGERNLWSFCCQRARILKAPALWGKPRYTSPWRTGTMSLRPCLSARVLPRLLPNFLF